MDLTYHTEQLLLLVEFRVVHLDDAVNPGKASEQFNLAQKSLDRRGVWVCGFVEAMLTDSMQPKLHQVLDYNQYGSEPVSRIIDRSE